MSTLAQALTLAGNRSSGAPVRTQNGEFCGENILVKFFSEVHHMFDDFIEINLKKDVR
jgi:hypothetical protein